MPRDPYRELDGGAGHPCTVLLCLTVIGIPLDVADFKMVPISLMPLGKDIVSTRGGAFDQAMAKQGV